METNRRSQSASEEAPDPVYLPQDRRRRALRRQRDQGGPPGDENHQPRVRCHDRRLQSVTRQAGNRQSGTEGIAGHNRGIAAAYCRAAVTKKGDQERGPRKGTKKGDKYIYFEGSNKCTYPPCFGQINVLIPFL